MGTERSWALVVVLASVGCAFDTGGLGSSGMGSDSASGSSGSVDSDGSAGTSTTAASSGGDASGGQDTGSSSGSPAPGTTSSMGTSMGTTEDGSGSTTTDPSETTGVEPGEPIDGFWDDFDDGIVDARWSLLETGACSVGENGGRASFSANGGGEARCAFVSVDTYDITDGDFSVDIPAITSFHAPLRTFLSVANPAGDSLEFGFDGADVFYARVVVDGGEVLFETSGYEPRPRYWQIRELGGELYLESSTDGDAWELEFQLPAPFNLAAVHISIGVSTSDTMASSIGIGVPNFNILP